MVLLEPMLGEGGVQPAPPGYLTDAARTAAASGALFAVDEVQTGTGRTGHWFAHQAEGVAPDVVTLAKAIGGGLPLGVTLAFGDAADLMTAGSHGSTFGGNPIAAAAALAVLDTIRDEGLLERAKELETRLREAGFLANAVAPDVLRLAPSLVLTDAQVDAFVAALPAALDAATGD